MMEKRKQILAFVAVTVIITASIAAAVLLTKGTGSTTTPRSDVDLLIFGNANEDDTIDQLDVEFIRDVIDGKRDASNLTDANLDGSINQADIDQVEALMHQQQTRIYYIDVDGVNSSVKYPVSTMISTYNLYTEIVVILNATDKVIGIDDSIKKYTTLFPTLTSLPSVGIRSTPNVEAILTINPDIYYTGTRANYDIQLETKLAANDTDIDVVRLPSWEYGRVMQGVLMMGWILGHQEEAYKYMEWHDEVLKEITDKIATVSLEGRVTTLVTSGTQAHSFGSGDFEDSETAGADNVGRLLYAGNKYITYENEWAIEQNPDFIIGTVRGGYNENPSGLYTLQETLEDALSVSDAAKNSNIHILSYDILTGPSSIISIAYQAKWYYPDLLADLDPEALHQEYIDKFLGGAVDVSARGSFAL